MAWYGFLSADEALDVVTYTRAKQIIWHPDGLAGPWGADIARQAAEQIVKNIYAVPADKERAKAMLDGHP